MRAVIVSQTIKQQPEESRGGDARGYGGMKLRHRRGSLLPTAVFRRMCASCQYVVVACLRTPEDWSS